MWDGMFLPMQKSVAAVRFVPLMEMTNEDWAILEFDYLRSVAKNRIAALIEAGQLVGFFHVNVETKAIKPGKPDYFWPATAAMVATFAAASAHDFFKNEADDEFDEDYTTRIDYLVSLVLLLTAASLLVLVEWIMAKWPSDPDVARLNEKATVLDRGHFALLIIIILLRYLTFDEVEALLESI